MRKFSFLLGGNLFELRANGRSERHDGSLMIKKKRVHDLTQWRALSPLPEPSRRMNPLD
jgi:hypothetical protein